MRGYKCSQHRGPTRHHTQSQHFSFTTTTVRCFSIFLVPYRGRRWKSGFSRSQASNRRNVKERRKARQRRRKARAKRQRANAEDRAFAMTLTNRESQIELPTPSYPHMEWDGQDFVPQPPAPSPFIAVEATMMEAAHKKLGVSWRGSRRGVFNPRQLKGLGDTGCQTCTAGTDFLDQIGAYCNSRSSRGDTV